MSLHHGSTMRGNLLVLVGVLVLLAACATGGTGTPAAPTGTAAFHTSLKTTDGQFALQFSVTPNRQGLNAFTVLAQDARSGKPAPNLHVQLTTTMLDMDMGTDQVDLSPDGPGQYSAQGTLSMSGHWEIHILLRTPDAALHRASIEMSTSV